MRKGTVVQPHIPGLSRSDRKPTVQRRSEKVLQAHTRGVAAGVGYASMETGTGRPRVECPECHYSFVPKGFMGNTKGLPDVFFFRYTPGWPAIMIPVEMKGEGTEITKEQQDLADAGRSVIAYSEEEALRAILAAELAMSSYQMHPERRELIERVLRESAERLK